MSCFTERLRRGEVVPVGHKLYAVCRECGGIVQINKWLLGSLHPCEPSAIPAPTPGETDNE